MVPIILGAISHDIGISLPLIIPKPIMDSMDSVMAIIFSSLGIRGMRKRQIDGTKSAVKMEENGWLRKRIE